MQAVLVSIIVAACAAYAAWTLSPSAARHWLRRVVLRRPATADVGCGACGGCGGGGGSAQAARKDQVIRIVRR